MDDLFSVHPTKERLLSALCDSYFSLWAGDQQVCTSRFSFKFKVQFCFFSLKYLFFLSAMSGKSYNIGAVKTGKGSILL